MGFFNPITYFFKQLIRIFTKKFFWVILISVCIFLGVLIFSPAVNATTGSSEKDEIIKNNFYYIMKFVQQNYGDFTDYVIFGQNTGINGKWYGFLIANPNGGRFYANNDYWFSGAYVVGGSINTEITYTSINDVDISIKNWNTPQQYTNNGQYPVKWFGAFSPNTIYTTTPIYGSSCTDNFGDLSKFNPIFTEPYFITTDEELQTFDFDYLQISGGSTPYYTSITENSEKHSADFKFRYIYKNVVSEIDVSNYVSVNSSTNTWQINVPYNAITNSVMVRNGETFTYNLYYEPYFGTSYSISTGELTYNLTSEQENQINEDSNKQLIDNIAENQKQTNERLDNVDNSINNMSNTLTDSNVDDSSVDDFASLGSDLDTEDVSGIDELFQKLYDAFCTDEVQDLTFTIPFTDKRVTINAANISDRFPEAITSIVGVFVWGMIGLYVLKDIRTTIDKIAEGSPEDVGSDVKKEVL